MKYPTLLNRRKCHHQPHEKASGEDPDFRPERNASPACSAKRFALRLFPFFIELVRCAHRVFRSLHHVSACKMRICSITCYFFRAWDIAWFAWLKKQRKQMRKFDVKGLGFTIQSFQVFPKPKRTCVEQNTRSIRLLPQMNFQYFFAKCFISCFQTLFFKKRTFSQEISIGVKGKSWAYRIKLTKLDELWALP